MTVSASFIRAWLALQRQLIPGLQLAYVELRSAGSPAGDLVVTAPESADVFDELALAARLASRSGAPVTGAGRRLQNGAATLRIARPLHLGRHGSGAQVIEVNAPLERRSALLQRLKWSEAWLNLALASRDARSDAGGYRSLLDASAAQTSYRDAVTAVLALLPERVGCTRAAMGRVAGGKVVLEAVSGLSEPDARSDRVRSLERAMQEALRQGTSLSWPERDREGVEVAFGGCDLTGRGALCGVCSVPVPLGTRTPMVFCFEFAEGIDDERAAIAACEEGAGIVAPLLELQRETRRPWGERMVALCRDGLEQLTGTEGRTGRIALAGAAVAIVALLFGSGEYRIAAPATLEGAVQRAVVAPFDGYVAESRARAGQEVEAGGLLARLDDRELVSERRKLRAEEGELAEEHRQAVATLDQGKARIVEAQLDQARARLTLVQDRLDRTELRAPLAGLIISGDLSRSLGVPVSRGELLFQISPLDEYRVVIQVSDRDIAELAEGQQGVLTLSALPRETVRFSVDGVSSMALDEVGAPAFRVEAILLGELERLRPGMQGVAKVVVGERRRWWIWTHALTDWVRLHIWRLLP